MNACLMCSGTDCAAMCAQGYCYAEEEQRRHSEEEARAMHEEEQRWLAEEEARWLAEQRGGPSGN